MFGTKNFKREYIMDTSKFGNLLAILNEVEMVEPSSIVY